MLVLDVMHCILEECVHYHCCHVLRIDAEQAKEQDLPPVAFVHDWMPHSCLVPKDFQVNNQSKLHQIEKIQNTLLLPFTSNIVTELPLGFVDEAELSKKLLRNDKQPLKFVCFSLDLLGSLGSQQTKKDFVSSLVQWVHVLLRTIIFKTLIPFLFQRCTKPFISEGSTNIKLCTVETIQYIQSVIKDTITPSWINSVPYNYGKASTGSIKADEWHILSTVYLPTALVTLWSEENKGSPASATHHL